MTNLIRSWNGRTIRIREDRYTSLTDMAQASGKLFADWNRLKSSESYLKNLSDFLGIPRTSLIEVIQGGIPELQGTWGHPSVAEEFQRWCSAKQNRQSELIFESSIRDKLALELNGVTEIVCKTGIVDIVTEEEIIEVKRIKHWKNAVGQILIYHLEFPDKHPRIHLFEQASDEYKLMILSFCSRLSVAVTFEHH